jgi:predicted nucleic acid-binding protein
VNALFHTNILSDYLNGIAERAVDVRQTDRLKLPNAIIRATALERSALLVTRNTKDFPSDQPGIRVPYVL